MFSAPLGGYNLPLPFFSDANAQLWHAAIGYEIAGILGILLCGGAIYGLTWLLRRSSGSPDDGRRGRRLDGRDDGAGGLT